MENVIREIQIRRKESDIKLLPEVVRNEANVYLSSVFNGSIPHRGLTEEEVHKYVARYLGVTKGVNPDYDAKIKEFFADITLKVDVAGLNLNMSIANGEPLHLLQWIHGRWAISHPLVASSKEEMDATISKKFYIYDPERAKVNQSEKVKLVTEAYVQYAQIIADKDDNVTLNRLLLMFGQEHHASDRLDKENALALIVQSDPKKFMNVASDPQLKLKAGIIDMINLDVLYKSGNAIMYADEILGHSLGQACTWFRNKDNSELVRQIKGMYASKKEDRAGTPVGEANLMAAEEALEKVEG